MAEIQKRRRIRCRFSPQINPNKAPNRLAVVKSILYPFVREAKALLGYVHPQHSVQTNRRSSASSLLRIERRYRLFQKTPWRYRFNFR